MLQVESEDWTPWCSLGDTEFVLRVLLPSFNQVLGDSPVGVSETSQVLSESPVRWPLRVASLSILRFCQRICLGDYAGRYLFGIREQDPYCKGVTHQVALRGPPGRPLWVMGLPRSFTESHLRWSTRAPLEHSPRLSKVICVNKLRGSMNQGVWSLVEL